MEDVVQHLCGIQEGLLLGLGCLELPGQEELFAETQPRAVLSRRLHCASLVRPGFPASRGDAPTGGYLCWELPSLPILFLVTEVVCFAYSLVLMQSLIFGDNL